MRSAPAAGLLFDRLEGGDAAPAASCCSLDIRASCGNQLAHSNGHGQPAVDDTPAEAKAASLPTGAPPSKGSTHDRLHHPPPRTAGRRHAQDRIRPTIDGRLGGVRSRWKRRPWPWPTTWPNCERPCATPTACRSGASSPTAPLAVYGVCGLPKFREGVGLTITVTPVGATAPRPWTWTHMPGGVGFNGTERPGASPRLRCWPDHTQGAARLRHLRP